MARVNQTNTTPELLLKYREKNMKTTEKMKPCNVENELKKIRNKYDVKNKKLKQRYDDECEKLKDEENQEIEKLVSDLLLRQNINPSKKQRAKRIASRPSPYPTFSGSSEEQHPTTKQPSQHSSYNTCPSTPGLSRRPTTELSNQYLSFHNPSEANLYLEEWPNNGSYDCTAGIRDHSVFNEMRYSDNSTFNYLIHSYTYENPTLISKDGQENNIRCQYGNIDMTNANDGTYSGS
ncbi:hypothetical protein F8M41_011017 [Gigaspora margarita]|uniref:Uncharacterized protein n=1 Tax=Gigaspora margarita TaxID=4874 RepID=A0A8H3X1C0_GIGMA|nr:hypothetical protein F8M41_011017 [Gigaspora margarita]